MADEGGGEIMMTAGGSGKDPFDLDRFVKAQDEVYHCALKELKSGQKKTHWMWYIFPQVDGLGRSPTARFYAIKSEEEARAYLNHPLLGPRLRECVEALLELEGRSAPEVFGHPDTEKLMSSMTLFERADKDSDSVFGRVLDKYYQGERDAGTVEILANL